MLDRNEAVTPDQETLPRDPAGGGRIGRYQLLEKVGGGGMGVVFKARHLALHRIVAVKILHPDRGHLQHLAARFWREMEAAGKLDHPHVVRATDAGQEGDTLFLAMEFVEGIDLDKLVRLLHPLGVAEVCELVRQAAIGLEAIRQADMVHRDIKPSNLILSSEGVVKILDVGLALLRDADSEANDELTPAGATLGTADYLAPEQAGNSKQVDIRADIYSLGCTMYNLLTGHPPYGSAKYPTWGAKLAAHLMEPLPPIERRSDIHAGVLAILERMTAKDRDARYSSPAELAEALRPWSNPNVRRLVNDESLASAAAIISPWLGEGDTPLARASTVVADNHLRKRNAPSWIFFAAAAIGAGGLLLAAGFWLKGSKTEEPIAKKTEEDPIVKLIPKTEPSKERMPDLDNLAKLRWHHVLDRPPAELLWNSGDGTSMYRFEEPLQQLSVVSESTCLLAMGRTTAPRFSLQMGVSQPRWGSGPGIFWGYRGADASSRQRQNFGPNCVACFQYLRFGTSKDGISSGNLSVERGLGGITEEKPGQRRVVTQLLDRSEAPRPIGEAILELIAEEGRLKQVRLGATELTNLTRNFGKRRFEAEDNQGAFGAFVTVATCTYRNVRIMTHD